MFLSPCTLCPPPFCLLSLLSSLPLPLPSLSLPDTAPLLPLVWLSNQLKNESTNPVSFSATVTSCPEENTGKNSASSVLRCAERLLAAPYTYMCVHV